MYCAKSLIFFSLTAFFESGKVVVLRRIANTRAILTHQTEVVVALEGAVTARVDWQLVHFENKKNFFTFFLIYLNFISLYLHTAEEQS
jgi:hypothetical protein